MLKMAQVEYIKHLYEVEGKSISYIARTLHLNRRTVRKYAGEYNWTPKEKTVEEKSYPVLGPYLKIIDGWLEDDIKSPRKQRHTGYRVYRRLVEEHGFKGSIRTVTKYVCKKKKEMYQKTDGYLPLEHLPGTAQADFGELIYTEGGEQKRGYYLTLSFPYSNAAFTQVFQGENQECVMEGLKRIFMYIGGVPSAILMDNMKPAVTILPNGEKELTEGFRRFVLHYRFEARFCNVASGNEKGNVENKIGYHRRNWFVPIPEIDNLEEFNQTLWHKAIEDLDRKHYRKKELMLNLWEQDKEKLLYLPENDFEVFRIKEAGVDKWGYVRLDDNRYAINPEFYGKQVTLKIYYDKVEIYHDHRHITSYSRCYEKDKEILDWRQYISLLCKKPGALEDVKFYNQIPKVWREHLKRAEKQERKTALILLREIIEDNNIEAGTAALKLAGMYGKTDAESVRQCYYGLTHETFNPKPCSFSMATPAINNKPELSVYDKLTKGMVM